MNGFEPRPELRAARLVDFEKPIVGTDVPIHLAFAGIGRLADVEGRRADVQRNERRVALDADDGEGARINRGRLVWHPVGVAPHDVLFHVGRKRRDDVIAADLDLVGHFRTHEHAVARGAHISDDEVAQLGEVALGGAIVDGVLHRIVGRGFARGRHAVVGRVTQARDHGGEFTLLEPMCAQVGKTAHLVAERHAELGIGAELDDGGLHALRFQVVARNGVAAEEERRAIHDRALIASERTDGKFERALAEIFQRAALGIAPGAEAGDRIAAHAEDADGLAGSLLEGDRVIGCGKTGTAAAEVEISVGPRLRQSGRGRFAIGADAALDDAQARESLREQVARTVAERAGPEHELGLGKLLLEDVERAGRVADVADVDALPRAAEQNARRTSGLGGGAQKRSEAGGGGRGGSGGKEVAAVHE